MSGNILLDSLVLFLLIYALLDIFTHFAQALASRFLKRPPACTYGVLFLSEGADRVEYTVRRAAAAICEAHCGLILVDMGLSGEARRIVGRLCGEYENIRLCKRQEYAAYVDKCCSSGAVPAFQENSFG